MNPLKEALLRGTRPIHEKYRREKIAAFLSLIGGQISMGRLLDVGGGPGINGEFLPLYGRFEEVVVVNIREQKLPEVEGVRMRELVADGRQLPFGAGAFEWVFSNAVIEHVGGWKEQERFANEIRRVAAKGYFVACPNRYFPIEPHTLLPFYQFLPKALQRKVARYSLGHMEEYEEIHLLTAGQLQRLFPEARVRSVGFPVLGNSIVAYYRGDEEIV
jgi:ubiquinone/menaquinone biosynthesis C-methylase UbiE